MNTKETKQKIKNFFAKYIGNSDFDDDKDLFGSGLVNSLFAMQLVLFIEKEYKVKVENEDLDIENFKSVNAISNFIQKKTA